MGLRNRSRRVVRHLSRFQVTQYRLSLRHLHKHLPSPAHRRSQTHRRKSRLMGAVEVTAGILAWAASLGIVAVRMGIGMFFSFPLSFYLIWRDLRAEHQRLTRQTSGSIALYCADPKCQPDFGNCGGGSQPATSSQASPSSQSPSQKKTSTDGSCGGDSGNTCLGSTFGDCCSSYGYWYATPSYFLPSWALTSLAFFILASHAQRR